MTSFFRFVNKWAIYRLGIISLAHAPIHVTDFLVVNIHDDELSSAQKLWWIPEYNTNSNTTSFLRFVDKRAIYRWYNLVHTCAGECDWLFHWQHKWCVTLSANVHINYRLPIKVYYRICTLRHIRIKINHGSQNVFWVLTWIGGY